MGLQFEGQGETDFQNQAKFSHPQSVAVFLAQTDPNVAKVSVDWRWLCKYYYIE